MNSFCHDSNSNIISFHSFSILLIQIQHTHFYHQSNGSNIIPCFFYILVFIPNSINSILLLIFSYDHKNIDLFQSNKRTRRYCSLVAEVDLVSKHRVDFSCTRMNNKSRFSLEQRHEHTASFLLKRSTFK